MNIPKIVNPILTEKVESDNELKQWLVNYVGKITNPSDGNVTVEMIVDVLSKEFPEFLMVVAEENFIRGYQQAFADLESSEPGIGKKAKRKK